MFVTGERNASMEAAAGGGNSQSCRSRQAIEAQGTVTVPDPLDFGLTWPV